MHALLDLEKHAAQYVNLPRLQLALDSLRQSAGDETIRMAVYSWPPKTEIGGNGYQTAGQTTKEVLRLLLADPLSTEQEWERQLMDHDMQTPLIIRVGKTNQSYGNTDTSLRLTQGGEVKELHVSSPGLNEHKWEFLLLKHDQLAGFQQEGERDVEAALLVPEVNLPNTTTSQSPPATAPVHRAVLITDTISGICSLGKLIPHAESINVAANMTGFTPKNSTDSFPLPIDVEPAKEGVAVFRQSVDKAFEYQKLWTKSNLGTLSSVLKNGSTSTDSGTTKGNVLRLVSSLLRTANRSIGDVEERTVRSGVNSLPQPNRIASLNNDLDAWSEKAHAELQGELDRAFTSRRWKKLNWWKLFWRVDDVGMLSSEMLSQRFLPRAERNVIYLAGQVEGSGVWYPDNGKAVYSIPTPPAILGETNPTATSSKEAAAPGQQLANALAARGTRWPTHITFTRNYLQSATIPALQALAQKLVIQSAGFSTLTSSLGALMYLSSFGLSEAGAVAALGIVWSLRRLQKKWETAREYWQSEVREEGRKAVRAVEISVGEAIDRAVQRRTHWEKDGVVEKEIEEARRAVRKAEEALQKLK